MAHEAAEGDVIDTGGRVPDGDGRAGRSPPEAFHVAGQQGVMGSQAVGHEAAQEVGHEGRSLAAGKAEGKRLWGRMGQETFQPLTPLREHRVGGLDNHGSGVGKVHDLDP